jgi:hypothetical protein
VHNYYRTCPVRDGTCRAGARSAAAASGGGETVHIVAGAAGHELTREPNLDAVDWVDAFVSEYGYATLDIGGRSMTVRFVSSDNGTVLDEAVLYPHPGLCTARGGGGGAGAAAA